MDEDRRKHLEIIQAIISRMASNSFQLKGWSVALAAALLAFGAESKEPLVAWTALLPVCIFWGLDAYYLSLERQFRQLYARVALRDYAADSDRYPFSVDLDRPHSSSAFWRCVVTPAVLLVHAASVGTVLGALTLVPYLAGQASKQVTTAPTPKVVKPSRLPAQIRGNQDPHGVARDAQP